MLLHCASKPLPCSAAYLLHSSVECITTSFRLAVTAIHEAITLMPPTTPWGSALAELPAVPAVALYSITRVLLSIPPCAEDLVSYLVRVLLLLPLAVHKGWVTDDRPERGGAELAALLPSIPADRLMIETDAPYLASRSIQPSKARPNRNEPALLPHVLQAVAAALGQSEEEVAQRTTSVAKAFFRLPDGVLSG